MPHSSGGEGEVFCPETNHEHGGWRSMDVTLNFSVDQAFDMLFTDCPFFRNFLDSQRTTGKFCGFVYVNSIAKPEPQL